MRTPRNLVILALVLACAWVALSQDRRAAIARKLADARRFVSHRLVDEEARASAATEEWENEGGAIRT